MMWSEFIEGTGCKCTEHNYKIFENLEAMYMNTNMSKDEVYEYGKKLVDNSKTKEEIQFEQRINDEIVELKQIIESHKMWIEYYQHLDGSKDMIKWYREDIKVVKQRINELKWCLA